MSEYFFVFWNKEEFGLLNGFTFFFYRIKTQDILYNLFFSYNVIYNLTHSLLSIPIYRTFYYN